MRSPSEGADVVSVVGARPQFIKMAAVSRAIAADGRLRERLIHTGQHFDRGLSEVFFRELDIAKPSRNLGIHGGRHGEMTGRMLQALEEIFLTEQPQAVIVFGDTNSTLAGALAAAKLHIPVAHVEAGLRSFNRRMPEETNRVVVDNVSDLLLCPTSTAVANLEAEGLVEGAHWIGDVMYDAALHAAARAKKSTILEQLDLEAGRYAVATVHRAENTDDADALHEVLAYLRDAAADLSVVMPLHPRTRQAAQRFGLNFDGIKTCEPLGYLDMTRLLQSARMLLTDSGGLQKEAYFHRVPCVTLREETEWVETVACGWNRLWRSPRYEPRCEIHEYGEGRAGERAVSLLVERLCRSERSG